MHVELVSATTHLRRALIGGGIGSLLFGASACAPVPPPSAVQRPSGLSTPLTLARLNANIDTYSDGTTYTRFFPSDLAVDEVRFVLRRDQRTRANVTQLSNDHRVTSIAANVSNAYRVHTLMNTIDGRVGSTNARIEFRSSNGAFHSIDLVQGKHLRDHFFGNFNNTIDGLNAVGVAAFPRRRGRAHLDMQTFELPAVFHDSSLREIRLTLLSSSRVEGWPFVAAITAVSPLPT